MNVIASRSQLRASFVRWALVTVPAVLLLGLLAGRLGGSADSAWFQSLVRPDIFPPPMWFGIVWSILYVMLGFALALVCSAWGARGRTAAIVMFLVQLAVNLAWSPIFFGQHQITGGLILIAVLDVLVIVTAVMFWRARKLAAVLMLPYLAWILFATVLNYEFLRLNPDADGVQSSGAVQRMEF
ncbi:TspO/MBR family protein [Allopontixanthobacter sediminis]|uniref:Tryptophan-rich sensory protein n=1 Tax=Allopontixanthobacter sediminis TaxID=1689985 RepID=A0A845AUN3_9SPHN|nr:TspO/MBR family protein [Allopontixanthobacter sediminis]MXP43253.1 tryptophan-rich sensory protein [Allopontixanthobacter sediminis]